MFLGLRRIVSVTVTVTSGFDKMIAQVPTGGQILGWFHDHGLPPPINTNYPFSISDFMGSEPAHPDFPFSSVSSKFEGGFMRKFDSSGAMLPLEQYIPGTLHPSVTDAGQIKNSTRKIKC